MRKSLRSSKKTKMGKIKLPMDIRDKSQIPAFEEALENGPMMIVLVYADWCGHCTKYKDNVWNPLKNIKDRKMNMASVHYDQLENTSLKNSKIEGYPSLLVAGPDKTPATFKNADGTSTNALPKSNDFTTIKNLVTSPVIDESDSDTESNINDFTPMSRNSNSSKNISNTLNTAIVKKPINSSLSSSTSSELPPISNSRTRNLPKIKNSAMNSANSMNSAMNSANSMNSATNTNSSMNSATNTNSSMNSVTNTNSSMNSATNTNSSMNSATNTNSSMNSATDNLSDNMVNSSDMADEMPDDMADEMPDEMPDEMANSSDVTPPTISEDIVSLTNSTKLANSSAPPPVTMMGGKLYRMLTHKKKKSKRKGTRKHK